MVYKLSNKEIDEARQHLSDAEDIFRRQSLHLAKVINDAQYTAINMLDALNQ